MLEMVDVSKSYRGVAAVRTLSLSAQPIPGIVKNRRRGGAI